MEMYAHVVDLGVRKLELTNYVAGVCCNDAEAYDQDDAAESTVSLRLGQLLGNRTYGTIPMAARAEGSERMPREMVSAIMTASISVKCCL